MRKVILTLSLVGLAACADKLTGPEAQAVVRSHRDEVIKSSVLVFVDGAEKDTAFLRRLDADRIESIEVIKGKTAREVYGDRAQSRVILVRTKQKK